MENNAPIIISDHNIKTTTKSHELARTIPVLMRPFCKCSHHNNLRLRSRQSGHNNSNCIIIPRAPLKRCGSQNIFVPSIMLSNIMSLAPKIEELHVGRLMRPDIVHFHYACLGTEIFLRELTLSSTLSSNPKTSRAVNTQFSHKMLFYLRQFHNKFFHCSTTRIDDATRLYHSKRPISINQSSF
jgi:hypothetical protein